ncbi:hypothetical protein HDU99_007232, partial [Rhizoclosmatium hyalinum]
MLFMNPNNYNDIEQSVLGDSDIKVVHVVLTAGENGIEDFHYAAGREEGFMNSVRRSVQLPLRNDPNHPRDDKVFNGHSIKSNSYGSYGNHDFPNTVTYQFRLPDGIGGDGSHWGSLKTLKDGAKPLSSLDIFPDKAGDTATTYVDWADLIQTLRELIIFEARGSPTVFFNIPEKDTTLNVGTHPDHQHVGILLDDLLDQTSELDCAGLNRYVDYATSEALGNLGWPVTGNDLYHDREIYNANNEAMNEYWIQNGLGWRAPDHLEWIGRHKVDNIRPASFNCAL